MMGAGNASSTLYKTNVNLNTFGGNKKQGLTSRVGLDPWANVAVQTYSNGIGRNKLFCMNQLGGVGAGRSMFNGRFTQTDGIHCSKDYRFSQVTLTIPSIPMKKHFIGDNLIYDGFFANKPREISTIIYRCYNPILDTYTPPVVYVNNTLNVGFERYNGLTQPYWKGANANNGGFDPQAIYHQFTIQNGLDGFCSLTQTVPIAAYISVVVYYNWNSEDWPPDIVPTQRAIKYTTDEMTFSIANRTIANPFQVGNPTIKSIQEGTIYSQPSISNDSVTRNRTVYTTGASIYRLSVEASLLDIADAGLGCADTYLMSPGQYLPPVSYLPVLNQTDFQYGYFLMKLPKTFDITKDMIYQSYDCVFISISSCFQLLNNITPESAFNAYTDSLHRDGCIFFKPPVYKPDGGGCANSPFSVNTQMYLDDRSSLLVDDQNQAYMFCLYAPLQEVHDDYYMPNTVNLLGAYSCINSTTGPRSNRYQTSSQLSNVNAFLLPAPNSLWTIRYRTPSTTWQGSPSNVGCSFTDFSLANPAEMGSYYPLFQPVEASSIDHLVSKLRWNKSTSNIEII
jgi:hypothetical protein